MLQWAKDWLTPKEELAEELAEKCAENSPFAKTHDHQTLKECGLSYIKDTYSKTRIIQQLDRERRYQQ